MELISSVYKAATNQSENLHGYSFFCTQVVGHSIVPGVSVTVTGRSVGFSRTVQSDSQGVFRFPQIPAGTYKLATAPISGFAATTVEEVTMTIESVTVANIKLGLASTAESVVVTSDQLG